MLAAKRPKLTDIHALVEPAVLLILKEDADLHGEEQHRQQAQQPHHDDNSSSQQESGGGSEGEHSRSHGQTAMSSVGTAVLVGPSTALTAGHNLLPNDKKEGTKVRLVRPGSAPASRCREELQFVVLSVDDAKDLAILGMEQDQPQQKQWLKLDEGNGEDVLNKDLRVASYLIALQPHLHEFDTSLALMRAFPLKLCHNSEIMLYGGATTFRGCSGCPLVTVQGTLVGIHLETANAFPDKSVLTIEDLATAENQALCLACLLYNDATKQWLEKFCRTG